MPVPSDPKQTWSDAIPGLRLSREEHLAEDRLAQTDRMIGLEQQRNELRKASLAGPSETAAIEATHAIHVSLGRRIGRAALRRMPLLRRIKRRVLR